MLLAQKDDLEAFECLVELHHKKVANLIYQMLGGANDVEDLSQQVFIKLWKSRKRYQPKAKFLTFLFMITKRLVFNEMKRSHRRHEVTHFEAETEDTYSETDLQAKSLSSDVIELKLEKNRAIEAAIQALPKKAQMAIHLIKDNGMSYDEIAGVLGVSVSALKSLLFRARGELKKQLAHYLDD